MASQFEPRRRKVRILATLGPASNTPEMIRKLADAGADAFRINMSHGTHADHLKLIEAIRGLEKELGRPATIGEEQWVQAKTLMAEPTNMGAAAVAKLLGVSRQAIYKRLDKDKAIGASTAPTALPSPAPLSERAASPVPASPPIVARACRVLRLSSVAGFLHRAVAV